MNNNSTAINKKYPYNTPNCLECIWFKNNTGHINYCEIYGFENLIPTIKGCDRGD